MSLPICVACGVQYEGTIASPPVSCPVCEDERQYVRREGQAWTTLEALRETERVNRVIEVEPGLYSVQTEPRVAIGQRALLVQSDAGNVLWDCVTYLDDSTVEVIRQLGGIRYIAISHPHYYSAMVEWAEAFDAQIVLHEDSKEWVMRPSERITFWSGDALELAAGVTMLRVGGHFTGSAVLHWQQGQAGKGVLLTGDTIYVVADRKWVSFMYSYPNLIPLPAFEVESIRDLVQAYEFDRLYGAWPHSVVETDARQAVIRSADRYIAALTSRPQNKVKNRL